MDLLFKNPPYFFSTYFDVFWVYGLLTFFVCFLLVLPLSAKNRSGKTKGWLFAALYAGYLTLLLCTTVLNRNRVGIREIMLDPVHGFVQIITQGDVHSLREILSNILLFLPFGILTPVCLRMRRAKSVILAGLALSVTIEVTQYLLAVGYSETEDVIANVIGVICGYLLLCGVNAVRAKALKGNSAGHEKADI